MRGSDNIARTVAGTEPRFAEWQEWALRQFDVLLAGADKRNIPPGLFGFWLGGVVGGLLQSAEAQGRPVDEIRELIEVGMAHGYQTAATRAALEEAKDA